MTFYKLPSFLLPINFLTLTFMIAFCLTLIRVETIEMVAMQEWRHVTGNLWRLRRRARQSRGGDRADDGQNAPVTSWFFCHLVLRRLWVSPFLSLDLLLADVDQGGELPSPSAQSRGRRSDRRAVLSSPPPASSGCHHFLALTCCWQMSTREEDFHRHLPRLLRRHHQQISDHLGGSAG